MDREDNFIKLLLFNCELFSNSELLSFNLLEGHNLILNLFFINLINGFKFSKSFIVLLGLFLSINFSFMRIRLFFPSLFYDKK